MSIFLLVWEVECIRERGVRGVGVSVYVLKKDFFGIEINSMVKI